MSAGETNAAIGGPVRVATVAACAFPANHGTPGAIRELGLHLARQGHEVHVVTYPHSDDIPAEGLHIHRVRLPFEQPSRIGIGPSFRRVFYDLLLVPKLVKVIRREKLEVIHAHSYEACIAGSVASLITRKPLIFNGIMTMADELPSYGSIPFKSLARWIGSVLDYVVPRLSDFIMVLSDEIKDYLLELGIDEQKILIVPPGVELEWLSSGNGLAVRQRLQLDPSAKIVLYTGVLEEFQRIDYLLQAMAIVSRSMPDAVLVIADNMKNDQACDRFSQMAAELGIGRNVKFIEGVPLEELPDYLDMADVAVIPRPSCPGFPIKLLNYIAAAIPVVSFAGSAKLLCHGYSGYVARDDDVADLARGIELFLGNADLAEKIGVRARDSLKGVFDWPTIARGVAEVYRCLIDDRRQVPRKNLAGSFKASYRPVLREARRISDFQLDGVLSYPSLATSPAKGDVA